MWEAGALVGCQPGAKLQGVVAVGTTKPDLFGLPAEFRALHAALENELGRPVRFNAQPSGAAPSRCYEASCRPFRRESSTPSRSLGSGSRR